MQIQWQLQHDVRPLPAWQPSPYVQVMNYLSFAARLFLPLIVVIIVADMVAGESTDGTIKLLLVRPVPRWKILMGKWLTSLGASALATAFVIIALWLVGVAVLGNVGASQPVTVGVQYVSLPASPLNQFGPPGAGSGTVLVPHYAHAVIIPMWQYLVTGGALTIFAMLAVASVAFLCSTLFRSAMASTGVAMGMTVVGFVLTIMAIRVKWLVWLFFPVHLALFDNWKGVLSEQAQMNVSLGLGMLVLAVWGAAALFVSLWAFSRRDILNA
jgi:ABC-2 type transport system permease protein